MTGTPNPTKMTINLMAHLQDYLPDMPLENVLELSWGSGMLMPCCKNRFQRIIGYLMICAMCSPNWLKNCRNPLIFSAAMRKTFLSTTIWLIASASAAQWFHQPDALSPIAKQAWKQTDYQRLQPLAKTI